MDNFIYKYSGRNNARSRRKFIRNSRGDLTLNSFYWDCSVNMFRDETTGETQRILIISRNRHCLSCIKEDMDRRYLINTHRNKEKIRDFKVDVKDILYRLNEKYKKSDNKHPYNRIKQELDLSIEEGLYLENFYLEEKYHDEHCVIKLDFIDIKLELFRNYVDDVDDYYLEGVFENYHVYFYEEYENCSIMIDSLKENDLIKEKLKIEDMEKTNIKRKRI